MEASASVVTSRSFDHIDKRYIAANTTSTSSCNTKNGDNTEESCATENFLNDNIINDRISKNETPDNFLTDNKVSNDVGTYDNFLTDTISKSDTADNFLTEKIYKNDGAKTCLAPCEINKYDATNHSPSQLSTSPSPHSEKSACPSSCNERAPTASTELPATPRKVRKMATPTKKGRCTSRSPSPNAAQAIDLQSKNSEMTSNQAETDHINMKPPITVLVYHCWICADEFLDKWSIVLHLKQAHADRAELRGIELKMKSPLCVECGSTEGCEHFTRRGIQINRGEAQQVDAGSVEGGRRPEDKQLAWPCASCNQSFHSQKQLQRHRLKEHKGALNFQCSYCPSKFASHSHLMAHARTHTGYKPYPCTVCGSRFGRRSDLQRHSRTHTGEKPFKCVQCNRTFTQRCSLEKHARIHGRRSGGLACEQCGLVFQTVDELTRHSTAEHSDRKFPCTLCNKNFSAKHYLSLHMRSHTRDRRFSCSYCSHKFSNHAVLLRHEERLHRNKQDITCGTCGKTFQRQENLNRHMKTHTGEKEFKCSVCGQEFTEKGSMKRHFAAKHEEVKAHNCSDCGKGFSRKILLTRHMEKYHSRNENDPEDTEEEDEEDDEEEEDDVTEKRMIVNLFR